MYKAAILQRHFALGFVFSPGEQVCTSLLIPFNVSAYAARHNQWAYT